MLIEHKGHSPVVDPSAYVAPTAVLCGNVTVEANCRIMFGAVVTADAGPITIGPRTVIMENAVIRSWTGVPLAIGHDVYVGTGVSVNAATLEDDVYLAAGASIFPHAVVGAGSIVRTNGVVHIGAVLRPNSRVPDGWTAIGNPAQVISPGQDERFLVSAEGLNFSRAVFGEDREEVGTQRYLDFLAPHREDVVEG